MSDKIPSDIIEIATMSNGLQIWKIPNKEVGGFIYYSEENGAPLPALVDALISIECLDIILNDMKKTQGQLASKTIDEKDQEITKLLGEVVHYQQVGLKKIEKIHQQASTIASLEGEIMELRDSKLKDVKEINSLEAEIQRLQDAFDNNLKEFMLLGTHAKDLEAENERMKDQLDNIVPA